MAVIVSKNNTTLATANGFWRAEAYNIGMQSLGFLDLSTSRQIPVTFANAGNCQGLIITLRNFGAATPSSNMKTVTVTLQEFVASVWTDRTSTTFTGPQIANGTVQNSYGSWVTSFDFVSPYTVTTVASTWRFNIVQSGAPTGSWAIRTSDATNPFYVTWCDNAVTATSGADALIIRSYTEIDTSFTTKAYLGTGDTVYGVSCIVCKHPTSGAVAGVSLLTCLTPAAAYTFTIDGAMQLGAHSGFRLGTSAVPIPANKKFTLNMNTTPTVGTRNVSNIIAASFVDNNEDYKQSIFWYGEVPTQATINTSTTAASGQPNFTLATTPTTWQNGDRVYFPKRDGSNAGFSTDVNQYIISSIVGNVVTLTTNITNTGSVPVSNNCPVVNLERYGIKVSSNVGTFISLRTPGNIVISGCEMGNNPSIALIRAYSQNGGDDVANVVQWSITDNTVWTTAPLSQQTWFQNMPVPQTGVDFKRNIIMGKYPLGSLGNTATGSQGYGILSGIMNITDNISFAPVNGSPTLSQNDIVFQRNQIYHHTGNSVFYWATLTGANWTVEDNYFWGGGNANINLSNFINPASWARNKFNKGSVDMLVFGAGANIGYSVDDEFGVEAANITNDIRIDISSFTQWEFFSVGGSPIVSKTNIKNTVKGTYIKFTDYANVANDDRGIFKYGDTQRTGYLLGDTLVWNGSSWTAATAGQFALRFAPNDGVQLLTYQDNNGSTTIGNCQGLPVSVSMRINIPNAAFYAGTYILPRLRVTYDGSTQITNQAIAATGSQQLLVTFTPTTSISSITIQLEMASNATAPNNYAYLGEVIVGTPAGVLVDTTRLGSFSHGLPLGSTRSFPSPVSVWDELRVNHRSAGTFGQFVGKLLTVAKFLGLK